MCPVCFTENKVWCALKQCTCAVASTAVHKGLFWRSDVWWKSIYWAKIITGNYCNAIPWKFQKTKCQVKSNIAISISNRQDYFQIYLCATNEMYLIPCSMYSIVRKKLKGGKVVSCCLLLFNLQNLHGEIIPTIRSTKFFRNYFLVEKKSNFLLVQKDVKKI